MSQTQSEDDRGFRGCQQEMERDPDSELGVATVPRGGREQKGRRL